MAQIRAVEFYSGIGGLHRALSRTQLNAKVVRAFDWDETACRVYKANYGEDIVARTDISQLGAEELAVLGADLWLLSPSCQPYTVLNPNAKGEEDPRAKSFLHIIKDVIPDLAQKGKAPNWMLIENVAGFESSSTRETLINILQCCGYDTLELLLTPLQFGIPNSRLRYYLLARAQPLSFDAMPTSTDVSRCIPGQGEPWIETHEGLESASIQEYLDSAEDVEDTEFLKIPDRVLYKWGRLFDIVLPSSGRSCCFTRGYTKMVEGSGSILQMNENLETTEMFDEFLAAKGNTVETQPEKQEELVRILHPLRLRYFSPTELLRIFHFIPPLAQAASSLDTISDSSQTSEFSWPLDVSTKLKYRLIGNSVNVEVVRRLIEFLVGEDCTPQEKGEQFEAKVALA